MFLSSDFRDLFSTLNGCRVRYLVVGAHAVVFHSEPRYTKDLDIWVEATTENAQHVFDALARFGAPLGDMTQDDFTNPEMIYQIGVEPNRVDFMMSIAGVTFASAWRNKVRTTYEGVRIFVLGRRDLIRNKRLAARPQDLLDVHNLTRCAAKRKKHRRKPRS
jgi:hypothetical protein